MQPEIASKLNEKVPSYLLNSMISGRFADSHNTSTQLRFSDQVELTSEFGSFTKDYTISGEKVIVVMRNSVEEIRPPLEFIIANNGNSLLCTSCALFGIGQLWIRVE